MRDAFEYSDLTEEKCGTFVHHADLLDLSMPPAEQSLRPKRW